MEEIPAYAPAGAGPHLWLLVEKRGRTTRDVLRELARALGVAERDAGASGMKDKAARAVQWLSFPTSREPDPASLSGTGWRVLRASRHRNKLRTGHARGNRFEVAVRGGNLERARACAAALAARGFPNFFGPQRFGAAGRNAAVGKAILQGRLEDAEVRRHSRDRFLRRLCISAWQAEVFNRWLAGRMAERLFDRALPGDAMLVLGSGGLFLCEDPAADEARIARFEIAPAGPIFGHRMRPAAGEAKAREDRLLGAEGMTLEDLRRGGGEAEGTRRAGRLAVAVDLEPLEGGYLARFELPAGSYATVLMGELTKGEEEGEE